MYKDLMGATWDGLDRLTMFMYSDGPAGKPTGMAGLLQHPSIQQNALTNAIKRICGDSVKVPRISQLPLTLVKSVKSGVMMPTPSGSDATVAYVAVEGSEAAPVSVEVGAAPQHYDTHAAPSAWASNPEVVKVLRSLASPTYGGQVDGAQPIQTQPGLASPGPDVLASVAAALRTAVSSAGLHGGVPVACAQPYPWRMDAPTSYGAYQHTASATGWGPYHGRAANICASEVGHSAASYGAYQHTPSALGWGPYHGGAANTCASEVGHSAGAQADVWEDGGGTKRWMISHSDGSAPSYQDIIKWAMEMPGAAMGGPLIRNEARQVTYRSNAGKAEKGKGKNKSNKARADTAYCMVIKPVQGKGNVMIYNKTGMVQINCGPQMLPWFMKMVEPWTSA